MGLKEQEVDTEVKRNIRHNIRSQVCSATIVASFTRHNINPAITLTPVLPLCKRRARVASMTVKQIFWAILWRYLTQLV